MTNRVAIIGVGQSSFGKRPDSSIRDLTFEAFHEAIEDTKNLERDEIDASLVASSSGYDKQRSPAAVIAGYLELNPQPTFLTEAACASSTVALRTAWSFVKSGLHDVVAVIGYQKMTDMTSEAIQEVMGRAGDVMFESPFGTSMPAYYAMFARAHMDAYGTTEEDLAKVSVKNHYYSQYNPKAMFQKEFTLEKVLSSRVIASPLKSLDCCANSDGASCLIVANEAKAKKFAEQPVWIKGLGLGSTAMSLASRNPPFTGFESAKEAARQAYAMASIKPTDIDVAEVHDCFTIAELIAYGDLEFCKREDSPKMIRNEETHLGGRIPVNIDGGLLSKGHPVGATGGSQIRTLVHQLRGEGGKMQVDGAKIALGHNVGGIGMYTNVTILET